MSEKPANGRLKEINRRIAALVASLEELENADREYGSNSTEVGKFVRESGKLIGKLEAVRETLSPVELGRIGITLGRSDSIAKFFAFSFLNEHKRPFSELESRRFYGSGVYALYYCGKKVPSYSALSDTETPIYVGKTDPDNPYAETSEAQGMALCKRLREHAKNISKTQLSLADFQYRAAPIQSGMQAAVEGFLIAFFKPIWNKEIGICFGLGKHGDKAGTRQNKRSPWDTMHPGRKWALATKEDQLPRKEIEDGIREHLSRHPPIPTREELLSKLALTA
jgi:hypothetical protein